MNNTEIIIEDNSENREKNKIKIVHMFPKLLSLYGEYGNVSILKKYLQESGYEIEIVEYEDGRLPNLNDASFVYIGCGTEENLIEGRRRLIDCEEIIKESLKDNKSNTVWLATGNSLSLLGKTIKWKGQEISGIGAFDFYSEISSEERFATDVLSSCNNIFCSQIVGYVNTSSKLLGIKNPLCELLLGKNAGNDKISNMEGLITERFYGTQIIGPLLVKNPEILKTLFEAITGQRLSLSKEDNIVKAYESSLSQLNLRTKE